MERCMSPIVRLPNPMSLERTDIALEAFREASAMPTSQADAYLRGRFRPARTLPRWRNVQDLRASWHALL
jgi:hypothetical protein